MNRFLPIVLFAFLSFTSVAQSNFKTVGYLASWNFDQLDKIEWQYLTHVNLAFINPDLAGNFSADGLPVTQPVKAARNCKVLASLAGGYLPPDIEAAWDYWLQPGNRPVFVQKIVQYLLDNHLDGVDIDLEWQYVHDTYSPFILELKAALVPHNLLLTAALPGSYRYPEITDEALGAFDWINMMVYDLRGPWDPSNPGQHSPYWWAEDCIDYWQDQGIPPYKLTLGVPFYGYNFGVSPVSAFTYRYMVSLDTDNAYLDQIDQRWYNGIPTIKAKTQLALDKVAGIMIWELGQDVLAANVKQYSLLRAIDEVVHPPVSAVPEVAVSDALTIFPNPAQRWIEIPPLEAATVVDMQGRVLWQTEHFSGGAVKVDGWPAGMYVVQGHLGSKLMSARFVKAGD